MVTACAPVEIIDPAKVRTVHAAALEMRVFIVKIPPLVMLAAACVGLPWNRPIVALAVYPKIMWDVRSQR